MKRSRDCVVLERQKKPPIRLTEKPKTYYLCYVPYWELDNETSYGKAITSEMEKYFKKFNWCLVTVPKMISGESATEFNEIKNEG